MNSSARTPRRVAVRPRSTKWDRLHRLFSPGDPVPRKQEEPTGLSGNGLSPGGLLRDPSPEVLRTALETVASAVNERARVRLVDPLPSDPVLLKPFGLMVDNGNPWANGHEFAPVTSSVGAAWCTFGGVKYVRVWGLRGHVHGQAHSFLLLPEPSDREERRNCWAAVFPRRVSRYRGRRQDRLIRILERIGPPGADDRVNLAPWRSRIRAHVPGVGVILSDDRPRTRLAQVVVRDPSTGFRHHLSVPPRFGNPRTKTFQDLISARARIHAALAWTFGLEPDAYAPALEA